MSVLAFPLAHRADRTTSATSRHLSLVPPLAEAPSTPAAAPAARPTPVARVAAPVRPAPARPTPVRPLAQPAIEPLVGVERVGGLREGAEITLPDGVSSRVVTARPQMRRVAPPVARVAGVSAPVAEPTKMRLTERGVRFFLALGLVLTVTVGAAIGIAVNAAGEAGPVASVTVVEGDTLWKIAAGVAAPGADLGPVMEQIRELNGLASSTIQAGQELLVPTAH